jgi:hypothetical protein
VATRAQVNDLLSAGHSFETAAGELGIEPGLAYLLATGRPLDDAEEPRQDLLGPPPYNPTRNERVTAWVAARAERELGGSR